MDWSHTEMGIVLFTCSTTKHKDPGFPCEYDKIPWRTNSHWGMDIIMPENKIKQNAFYSKCCKKPKIKSK